MTPSNMGFLAGRPGNTIRGAAAVGRLALGALGLVLLLQIALRLLYRIMPSRFLARMTLALDAPIRRRVLNPTIISRRVGLRPGMRVLHLGRGNGGLTEALAATVGATGRVEAAALDSDERERARSYLDTRGVDNASVVPGLGARLPFDDQSFDAACLESTLGRVEDPQKTLAEVWRVLRPSGRLSISDVISDPSFLLRNIVVGRAEKAGFEWLESFGDSVAYTINFRKPLSVAAV